MVDRSIDSLTDRSDTCKFSDDLVPVVEAFSARLAARQVARRAAGALVALVAGDARLTLAPARETIALLRGRALTIALARCTRATHSKQSRSRRGATTAGGVAQQRWNRVSGSRVSGSPSQQFWSGSGRVTGQSPDPAF